MKKLFQICLSLAAYSNTIAQEDLSGAKPKISIGGNVCAILNQQFSCLTRECDSVFLMQNDSIEFCTYNQIDLSTDTAYYMKWHFAGSGNFPDTIFNFVPTAVPVCYYPKWNAAGTYTVNIYYNGWLTAYPWSDCYTYGPSHWVVKVIVEQAGGIAENSEAGKIILFPNPAGQKTALIVLWGAIGNSSWQPEEYIVRIKNSLGQTIHEQCMPPHSLSGILRASISTSEWRRGLYLVEVCAGKNATCYTGKLIVD